MSQYVLERSVLIRAERATVYRFFEESELFAAWWGEGSTIEPREGGAVRIVYPGGSVASGSVVAMEPGASVRFTFGYEGEGKPIAPGSTTVTMRFEDHPLGTLVSLSHAFDDAAVRDMHVPGWRYQLALFANAAAGVQHAGIEGVVDRYFALWSEADESARAAALAEIATEDVTFRDAFACVSGRDELVAHITAALAHGAGGALEREGPARQVQGTVLVDWVVRGPDGNPAMSGTNACELAPDGRLCAVVGFWSPPSA